MIRWLTDAVGTAAYGDPDTAGAGLTVVDVRVLGDRPGNAPEELSAFVEQAATVLRRGEPVVVCCDMGLSRSNAIAIGALLATGTSYEDAMAAYLRSTDDRAIDPFLLRDVRAVVLGERAPAPTGDGVLVLGATGYLGAHLVARLGADGTPVVTLDRHEHDPARDSVAVGHLLDARNVGTIVHLAHPRRRNGAAAMGEAVALTRAVLDLCRLHGCRLVHASTLQVFAGLVGDHVVSGATPATPKGVYAESKALCEQLVAWQPDVASCVLRLGAVYGPGMEPTTFIAKYVAWAAAGEPITTHVYRNGPPAFDFLYVDDAVDALARATRRPVEGTLAVGAGRSVSTPEVADAVRRAVGADVPARVLRIDDVVARPVADPAEAHDRLGWHPTVDLDEGLRRQWEASR